VRTHQFALCRLRVGRLVRVVSIDTLLIRLGHRLLDETKLRAQTRADEPRWQISLQLSNQTTLVAGWVPETLASSLPMCGSRRQHLTRAARARRGVLRGAEESGDLVRRVGADG
jgi:hypothetical protein